MIYFLYGEPARSAGYPEIGSIIGNPKLSSIRFTEKAMADFIFKFRDGKTVYIKNRHNAPPDGYQYTEEERLVIALRAVPI